MIQKKMVFHRCVHDWKNSWYLRKTEIAKPFSVGQISMRALSPARLCLQEYSSEGFPRDLWMVSCSKRYLRLHFILFDL